MVMKMNIVEAFLLAMADNKAASLRDFYHQLFRAVVINSVQKALRAIKWQFCGYHVREIAFSFSSFTPQIA